MGDNSRKFETEKEDKMKIVPKRLQKLKVNIPFSTHSFNISQDGGE